MKKKSYGIGILGLSRPLPLERIALGDIKLLIQMNNNYETTDGLSVMGLSIISCSVIKIIR